MITDLLKQEIKNVALTVLGEVSTFTLEHPGDLSHGDYSTNIAMVAAKRAGKNPRELAEEIRAALGEIEHVEQIEIAGPGFINFYLTREFFVSATEEILAAGNNWGKNDSLAGQKVMCEYTDPNPFKPFHIGHLMANAVGESIACLLEFSGAELKRANYQGDVGLHVAKALWGMRKKGYDGTNIDEIGESYVYGNARYEEDDTAKAEIVAINKAVYNGSDPELQTLYQVGRQTSLDRFQELYDLLGTKHDYFFFESQTWKRGAELVREHLEDGVFTESEGAIVYEGEKRSDKLHTRVFITKEGVPTYEAKDVGLALLKHETYPFDRSISITGIEQSRYFDVVFSAIAEMLPELTGKLEHVHHGLMQLTTGKMSSRKGNVITGESLIEEMREKAQARIEGRDLGEGANEVADSVAVGAIKYQILKQTAGKNIIFDPEASLSFEGDSGPYLQYSHTRACSIVRKAEAEGVSSDSKHGISDVQSEVIRLERLLYRFPEVVARAQVEYEPHYVATYLTELAGEFNSWYAATPIVDATDETSPYKVALTKAFQITMQNGLYLLGIKAPERM